MADKPRYRVYAIVLDTVYGNPVVLELQERDEDYRGAIVGIAHITNPGYQRRLFELLDQCTDDWRADAKPPRLSEMHGWPPASRVDVSSMQESREAIGRFLDSLKQWVDFANQDNWPVHYRDEWLPLVKWIEKIALGRAYKCGDCPGISPYSAKMPARPSSN